MKQMRYILTRPCLQEGVLRLQKYLESTFPESGPAVFVDDRGREHGVEIDRAAGVVRGLHGLYHDANLGVNDVLMVTPLEPGRYSAEGIVKPHAPITTPRTEHQRPPEPRRVVVTATPHVREVRMQHAEAGATSGRPAAPHTELPAREPLLPITEAPERSRAAASPGPVPGPLPETPESQLAELASLTGYQLSYAAPGVARLAAELGEFGYVVHVALTDSARRSGWESGADYTALLTGEGQKAAGTPRLTHEGLTALLEHARLAPLSPIDLRPYWEAGDLDLDAAAGVSELVGAHLAQRGAFSFVLLTLASQPAHSVLSVPRLAERLGSGVNPAELRSILDTLSRAPFLALTPLPGGQYLLRAGVAEMLRDVADYADGVRRRLRPATPASAQAAGTERAATLV
ncbi:hypothetical protein QOL99_13410 [Deinococcus sp. MIMF12]|uniref:DUF4388 domain-containing protein n=1 Tax=Deinococcus rhizophilus TaxID=3049544 RepID=A0ABT7JJA3_9DEIO|nr:hypothetical protein [Deinococcus rhizophilus]MDL2345142.1 hypothetical protein [Deinococcus rhizophilus]